MKVMKLKPVSKAGAPREVEEMAVENLTSAGPG